jgi:hypothetical protein
LFAFFGSRAASLPRPIQPLPSGTIERFCFRRPPKCLGFSRTWGVNDERRTMSKIGRVEEKVKPPAEEAEREPCTFCGFSCSPARKPYGLPVCAMCAERSSAALFVEVRA